MGPPIYSTGSRQVTLETYVMSGIQILKNPILSSSISLTSNHFGHILPLHDNLTHTRMFRPYFNIPFLFIRLMLQLPSLIIFQELLHHSIPFVFFQSINQFVLVSFDSLLHLLLLSSKLT